MRGSKHVFWVSSDVDFLIFMVLMDKCARFWLRELELDLAKGKGWVGLSLSIPTSSIPDLKFSWVGSDRPAEFSGHIGNEKYN